MNKYLVYFTANNDREYRYDYLYANDLDDGYDKACEKYGKENIVLIQEET